MSRANVSVQNFAAGELSPKMRGRFDLPIYYNGCERMRNFVALTQGPARFRPGTKHVLHTRLNRPANIISFQFNDEQAYVLEFTDKKLRFYKDNSFITETAQTITGATQADPVVITISGHGYSDGDEVFISGVGGMTELNGKTYLVANKTTNTFELTDVDGNDIDGSAFTAFTSGGTAQKIYEIDTPYDVDDDLFKLQYAQDADTMYIVHPFYEPRKLTRTGHTSWTLELFTRTADPFTDQKTITAATQANPVQITSTAHGLSTGDIVIIENITGMTELNSRYFTITKVDADNFTLDGEDGTGHTAYSSGGYATLRNLVPSVVTFYESRIFYGAPAASLQQFRGSRTPDSNGDPRYDDFTTGTDDDHAVDYTIASKEVNVIRWMSGNNRFLAIGTFGAEFKVTGNRDDEAITPTSIKVRPLSFFGVAAQLPVNRENVILFVQRGKETLRSLEYELVKDDFSPIDRNLVSDHITAGKIKEMAWQSGRPELLWMVTEAGELIGLTFKSKEDVSGWHLHTTDNGDDEFYSLAPMPRDTGFDQIWFVVKRTVNGNTRYYVEYLTDWATYPQLDDYYTAATAEDDDREKFLRAMFEAQKEYIYMDSALTYDGTSVGSDASAGVTPGATAVGTGVTFTADAAVFSSTDVGREIWKKAIDGVGEGRAEITAFVSSTEVTCTIKKAFDSTDKIAAGNWYLTTDSISGLDHLEGEELTIVTDGAVHPAKTVSGGSVTLDAQASKVHAGIGYEGYIKTMNIEVAGTVGPAQTKPKAIIRVGIRFHATLGAFYGSRFYNLDRILFRSTADYTDRPPPLFSGDRTIPYSDEWTLNKHVMVQQRQPLPCEIQMLVPHAETSNE